MIARRKLLPQGLQQSLALSRNHQPQPHCNTQETDDSECANSMRDSGQEAKIIYEYDEKKAKPETECHRITIWHLHTRFKPYI